MRLFLLTLFIGASAFAKLQGQLQLVIGDQLDHQPIQQQCLVTDSVSKKTHILKLKNEADYAKCHGTGEVTGSFDAATISSQTNTAQQPESNGVVNTLVLIAHSNLRSGNPDGSPGIVSCTESDLYERMFGPGNSVAQLYQQNTHQKVQIRGQVATVEIYIDPSDMSCNYPKWRDDAKIAAQNAGINVNSFQKIMYVVGSQGPCIGAAWATLNGADIWVQGRFCTPTASYTSLLAHEYGHSFGMHHANTVLAANGDESDPVSGNFGEELRFVNAPHADDMGWIDSSKIRTLTSSERITLSPLELSPLIALNHQLIKLPKFNGQTYYLSYRQPIGFDISLTTIPWRPANYYTKGLSIHQKAPGNYISPELVKVLENGQTYEDNNSSFKVTQVSQNTHGVTFDVVINGVPVPAPTTILISGRTVSPAGIGVLTDIKIHTAAGTIYTARTNASGYFQKEIPAQTSAMTLVASSRRYRFAPLILQPTGNHTNLLIQALE